MLDYGLIYDMVMGDRGNNLVMWNSCRLEAESFSGFGRYNAPWGAAH